MLCYAIAVHYNEQACTMQIIKGDKFTMPAWILEDPCVVGVGYEVLGASHTLDPLVALEPRGGTAVGWSTVLSWVAGCTSSGGRVKVKVKVKV
jgi:hypothetical protein